MEYCFLFLFLFPSFVAIAVRDKLESLCRELQRQNKMLMVCFSLDTLSLFDCCHTKVTICSLCTLYLIC